jgi:cytochrome P450
MTSTEALPAATAALPAHSVFDPDDLKSDSLIGRIVYWVVSDQWGLLKRFWPIPRIGKWAMVTRFDDVQEVLEHDQVFQVPFGPNVETLNGGPNFLLGMQDGPDYQRVHKQVLQAFRRDDIDTIVTPMAARMAAELVRKANGRIDAIHSLITRVPTLICQEYYGVPIPDVATFPGWTIAMSTFMFGNPTNKPEYRRIAIAGADRVRPIIDRAIARAKAATDDTGDTIVARLVRMQKAGAEGLSDEVIRSYLIGMITGFIPTNTMAAGHMLEMLLQRPEFMKAARDAALAGDDDRLKRCLFEAMRFWPLNPGPFRICVSDYTVAQGTPRAKRIPAGTNVLAGTRSAMLDPGKLDKPEQFNPDRPPTHYMLFGHGLHWCVGAYIAEAQITQTFKALLVKSNIRRTPGVDGKLRTFGPFPAFLTVTYDP